MIRPTHPALAALLGLTLLACKNTETLREQKVVEAVRQGRFDLAVAHAQDLYEANPGDPEIAALYRDTRVAAILERGRRQVFDGRLEDGLKSFQQALEIAPEHPTVLGWIEKTKKQLATYWLDRAASSTGPDKLDDAEQAYEQVLVHDPRNPFAIEGLAHVVLLKNYRSGQSKSYFDQGLRSFRDLRLQDALRSFEVSKHYSENESAATRGKQVATMLAEERLAQARTFESEGHYFAARNEYRLVLLIDPAHTEARDGFDRMDRETRAASAMAEADMEIRRGELEEAKETLTTAEVLTEAQKDGVSLLHSGIEEKRLADLYSEAQRLYEDSRFPEAVAAYAELLTLAPDYQDAAQRKRTIEEFIATAEDVYAKAQAASNDEDKAQLLRQALLLWPEYKDAVEQLAALEKKAPPPAEEPR